MPKQKQAAPKPCPACGGLRSSRNGFTRHLDQRYRCPDCDKSWQLTSGPTYPEIYNVTKLKLEDCKPLLQEGYSINYVAAAVGIHHRTIKKYLRDFLKTLKCPCGGPSGHKGWCGWRYNQSPRRQQVLTGKGDSSQGYQPSAQLISKYKEKQRKAEDKKAFLSRQESLKLSLNNLLEEIDSAKSDLKSSRK